MASAVTASVPILIVFVIFQRYIIQGVRMGDVSSREPSTSLCRKGSSKEATKKHSNTT